MQDVERTRETFVNQELGASDPQSIKITLLK